VLLADDHPGLLEEVRDLLEPAYEVVGRLNNGQSLVESALRLQPDVIVTDISMPVLNGIEAVSKLKEAGCRSRVVFLTVHDNPEYLQACRSKGGLGYVIKPRLSIDLLKAIRAALAGQEFVSQHLR